MANSTSQNDNGKVLPLKKIFLVLSGVVILIFLSESLYILKNSSPVLTRFFIERAQTASHKGDAEASLKNLQLAANTRIFYEAKQNSKLFPFWYAPKILLPGNPEFTQAYLSFAQNLNPEELNRLGDEYLAKVFYKLALISHEANQPDLIPLFLQTAVYLNPELSHLHIELANFYLAEGDQEKAKNELEFCLKFKSPVKHCQEYINNNLSSNFPEEVGFLEKGYEDYYKNLGS